MPAVVKVAAVPPAALLRVAQLVPSLEPSSVSVAPPNVPATWKVRSAHSVHSRPVPVGLAVVSDHDAKTTDPSPLDRSRDTVGSTAIVYYSLITERIV